METRKPLKTTILFIGIFLVGILMVVLFVNKALDTDQAVQTFENDTTRVEQVSQGSV